MQKKYQVFISSTYEDLKEERKNVIETLLMMDCIPAGMEAFCAADEEQFEYIKKVIDLCDYYVLIIGKRYGSISPITGKSYTEMEYDYAKEKGIPILVFPVYAKVNKPEDEYQEMLDTFKKKAYEKKMGAYWGNPDELGKKVAVSLGLAMKQYDRPGWIRGGQTEMILDSKQKDLNDAISFGEEKINIPYRDEFLGDMYAHLENKESTWGQLFLYVSPMLIEWVNSAKVAEKILEFAVGFSSSEYGLRNNFEYVFLMKFVDSGHIIQKESKGKTLYMLTVQGKNLMRRLLEESK